FKNSNLSTILTDMQKLKEWILSFGFWSYFVFVILQFLQVTFLPLPSSLTTLTGVVIFGPFYTFLLSTLSIMLGSIFAYLLGKTFGIKFLNLIFGKQRSASFQNKLKNSNIIFFFMMLFPMFPDDLLCMLAGVMNMNFKFFLITNLITRPVGLFCLCFIGAGYIIPFHSWGIWVWALIAIVFLCLIVVFFNKKSKIRRIFNDKVFVFNKKTNNKLG
ncbi:MAG: TVP38/TMEM64 family protein, partial [Clostridia bacterium]|nr:TVP38/TMEM64 family protein [Clostridia bacterium]